MKQLMMTGAIVLAISSLALGELVTLQFNPNDIFNYATSDDTRLNQLGTARLIWDSPTGRAYRTYNDAGRDAGATADLDLESVQTILEWNAWAGYQGVSHIQLWLQDGTAGAWGERIVQKPGTSLTASVNGEFGWVAYTTDSGGLSFVHYNTELGSDPTTNQNALSPDFNPAQQNWTVTGEFYVDEDGNGAYDPVVDTDLVFGDHYAVWFNAAFNNWHVVDAYGNNAWGNPDMQGTLLATVVPVPGAVLLGMLGLSVAGVKLRRHA